ncbi:7-cyano-7-deazaguanine synthase QueC [Parvularcula dongshanensis]|uniref:7-cyano-7-deazaguanine synthase n=1 Tax=Parvularcula dongshanensis TaxID=1173995 RepID=A0A840I3G1_9PROT|nr:7-cyano-7-deazaguanine synthase QueC [Parvularcula dongshanensis]MBB4658744.1 7-cyano-7-deazaguanine synthase [Parvularcula dongshanensis]
MQDNSHAALVLLSGGQDSATCLAWALDRFERVETIGFDYGQRHKVELEARQVVRRKLAALKDWGSRLGADHGADLRGLSQLGETAMTSEVAFAAEASGLPNTFVPGRNLAFLVLAGALAYRRGLGVLVGGMCQTDYSGYPDCREDAVQAQAEALRLGMATDMRVETPLMDLTKAQSWQLAETIGGEALVEVIRVDTHTCYRGERGTLHEWGYGCGDCPACELRAKGWREYRAR